MTNGPDFVMTQVTYNGYPICRVTDSNGFDRYFAFINDQMVEGKPTVFLPSGYDGKLQMVIFADMQMGIHLLLLTDTRDRSSLIS